MNKQVKQNSEDSIIVIDENQVKQFKSLYYLIKGKRDTDIKLFTKNKQFSYDSILELNEKVYRKLELHELITDIVNVNVGLDNKEIKSFGNWSEFRKSDWQISSTTRYITIEWDFNLILPNQDHKVPQTHTLRVRIGNNLKPSEMIQVVFQGGTEEYDLEESQSQMSCKIDFVNSQICNELKTVVSDWYEALPNNSEEHKLIRFIMKNERKFENFVILCFITASIILINFMFNAFLKSDLLSSSDIYHKLFISLTASIPIIFLFHQFGKLYADRMMRKQISKLRRNPMFEFTKGDKNKFGEIKDNNEKHIKGMLYSLLIGLSVNGITALAGYVITILTE